MVVLNKLYTKTGDEGSTALVDGSRVSKDSLQVDTYGEVDELNSVLGAVRTESDIENYSEISSAIAQIQNELFDIGAALATPQGFDKYPVFTVEEKHITQLETWIDNATEQVEALKSFVLPGGTRLNSQLHIARAISRRVERKIISLQQQIPVQKEITIYFNRLSDLLFALARLASSKANTPEYLWKPWNT